MKRLFCLLVILLSVTVSSVTAYADDIEFFKYFAVELGRAKTPQELNDLLEYYADYEYDLRKNNEYQRIVSQEFHDRFRNYNRNGEYYIDNLCALLNAGNRVSGGVDILDDAQFVHDFYNGVCSRITVSDDDLKANQQKQDFIDRCLRSVSGRYGVDAFNRGLRYWVDLSALQKTRSDNYYLCMFDTVAKYGGDLDNKLALIEYAEERARLYNNVRLQNLLQQLRQEIDKIKPND